MDYIILTVRFQFVSGVHVVNYWMSTFVWDMFNYLIPVLALLLVYFAFGIEPYYIDGNAGYARCLLFPLHTQSYIHNVCTTKCTRSWKVHVHAHTMYRVYAVSTCKLVCSLIKPRDVHAL